jgi:hypothetical protein
MKDEYDFSNAERGKFYRPGAQLIPPVHLDPEVLSYLSARADALEKSLDGATCKKFQRHGVILAGCLV